jgi:hypothetical protein
MTQELAAYGYLIAAICFIMALRGLSSPVTSRQGNLFGVVGMVVAIGVTIATPGVVSPWLIIGGVVVGGAIGTVVALRIHMTACRSSSRPSIRWSAWRRCSWRRRRSSRPRPSASARRARSRPRA